MDCNCNRDILCEVKGIFRFRCNISLWFLQFKGAVRGQMTEYRKQKTEGRQSLLFIAHCSLLINNICCLLSVSVFLIVGCATSLPVRQQTGHNKNIENKSHDADEQKAEQYETENYQP